MRTIAFYLTFLMFLSLDCLAQSEADWWYFGSNAGMHFTGSGPVSVSDGQVNSFEGVSSISDVSGDLQFYTDGVTVYNSSHGTMPNGTGLLGNFSSSNSAVIVPKPGSSSDYYIFTTDDAGGATGLNYSKVDMSLSGGLGDVVASEKNVHMMDSASEKLVAIPKNNGFWVIAYKLHTDEVNAFEVTSAGVSTTPVVSHTGYNLGSSFGFCMKASLQGDKIVTTRFSSDSIALFDFDKATGSITSTMMLGSTIPYNTLYGFEFSPDGQLLYIQSYYACNVSQYDLTLSTPALITASETLIGNSDSGGGALQLGPDGKLYIARNSLTKLSLISSPNTIGSGCGFVDLGVDLDSNTCGFGLPAVILYSTSAQFSCHDTCEGFDTYFLSELVGIDSLYWDFGDPSTGANNNSTLLNPTHLYSDSGIFNVTIVTYSSEGSDTIYKSVHILPDLILELGADTFFCGNDSVMLTAYSPYSTYLWSTGETTPTIMVGEEDYYYVTVFNPCDTLVDSIFIEDNPLLVGTMIYESFDDSVILYSPAGIDYSWNTGSTSSSIVVYDTGFYEVFYTLQNGCEGYASIYLSEQFFIGIQALNNGGIEVFPNPVEDVFTIRGDFQNTLEIELWDMSGRKVFQYQTSHINGEVQVKLPPFHSGIYFLSIQSGSNQFVSKLLIERD